MAMVVDTSKAPATERPAGTSLGSPTKTMTFDKSVDSKLKTKLDMLLAKYDTDGNGEFDRGEVEAIIYDLQKSKGQTKKVMGVAGALFFALLMMIAVMFMAVLVGNEQSKENHTKGSMLVNLDGNAVETAAVESFATLWDMPKLSTQTLAYMKEISVQVDMTADVAVAGEVEATFKTGGVWKPAGSTTVMTIGTVEGFVIKVDSDAETATITMGANTFPLIVQEPEVGRKLADCTQHDCGVKLLSRKQMEEVLQERRGRKLGLFSSMLGYASFNMGPGSGF